mgnify:CR=1 FL=1
MNKRTSLLILIILFFYNYYIGFSQKNYSIEYFNNLKKILSKREDISDVKYFEQKYFNGKIKMQFVAIRYKNSNIKKRFWCVGKNFSFYKSGGIRRIFTVDLNTNAFIDTTYNYDLEGNLISIILFDKNNEKLFARKVYYNFFSIFRSFYINFPEKHKVIKFKNGKKLSEKNFRFLNIYKLVSDGDFIYYKEDGSIDRIEKYEKGVLVK